MSKEFKIIEVKTSMHKRNLENIYFTIFEENLNKKNNKNIFDQHNIESFIFYNKDKNFIGICIVINMLSEIEILKFGIMNKFRNKGFGYKFFELIIEHYKRKKIENIFLEVSKCNKFALGLYESLGFKAINVRKNYYKKKNNTKVDAIVLKKQINSFL
tara:strand:+ start:217 stop:690 length:474 start_codon:yes stop_codon:yes gene_type:complete